MIITKEQQEVWVNAYVKEKHTADECIGFIDGVNKVLDVVNKNLVKPGVIKSACECKGHNGLKRNIDFNIICKKCNKLI